MSIKGLKNFSPSNNQQHLIANDKSAVFSFPSLRCLFLASQDALEVMRVTQSQR